MEVMGNKEGGLIKRKEDRSDTFRDLIQLYLAQAGILRVKYQFDSAGLRIFRQTPKRGAI